MLSLCSSCQRHVKSAPCPFCGSATIEPTQRLVGSPAGRSRASLLLGAAMVSATVGCNDRGGAAAPGTSGMSAPTLDADAAASAAHPSADIYGAPPVEPADAGAPAYLDRPPAAIYGAPPDMAPAPPKPRPTPKPH